MTISFGPEGFTVAMEVDACNSCGAADGAHHMCSVAAEEVRDLITTTDRERDAALDRAQKLEDQLGVARAFANSVDLPEFYEMRGLLRGTDV